MNFTENTLIDFMIAQTNFKGHKIDVRLRVEDITNLETIANNSIEYVSNNWSDIQNAIIDYLYDLYIDDWADEDDPKYSKEQFLEKIYPQTIDFDDYEDDECKPSYTMYFGDSGLFAGHGIQLYWKTGQKITNQAVSLVG